MSVIKYKTIIYKTNIKPEQHKSVAVPASTLDLPAYGFYIENRTDYDIYFSIDIQTDTLMQMYKVDANNWISDDSLFIKQNLYFYSENDLTDTDGVYVVLYNYDSMKIEDDVNILNWDKFDVKNIQNIENKSYNIQNIENKNENINKPPVVTSTVPSPKYKLCDDEVYLMEGEDDY